VQFEAFVSDTAETLVRLRGDVIISLSATGAAARDVLLVAWGIIRSASGSSDVGVSPLTEGGANYLAFGVATLISQATANIGITGGPMMRFDVDSKAMRKLRENESLYVIVETANINGAPLSDFAFALRGLTAR